MREGGEGNRCCLTIYSTAVYLYAGVQGMVWIRLFGHRQTRLSAEADGDNLLIRMSSLLIHPSMAREV